MDELRKQVAALYYEAEAEAAKADDDSDPWVIRYNTLGEVLDLFG